MAGLSLLLKHFRMPGEDSDGEEASQYGEVHSPQMQDGSELEMAEEYAGGSASTASTAKKRGRPKGAKDKAPRKKQNRHGTDAPKQSLVFDDANEEGGEQDKLRPRMRELLPTPRVGLWDTPVVPAVDGLPLPWHLQKHVYSQTSWANAWPNSEGAALPGSGPFNCSQMLTFLQRDQLEMAQLFAVPLDANGSEIASADVFSGLRSHDSDAALDYMQHENETSRVLFAAQHLHGPVKLDHACISHIKRVEVRQFHESRSTRLWQSGVNGGIVGAKKHTFFWISPEDGALTTPEDLLNLASLLCTALQPDNKQKLHHKFYPAVNTAYSDVQIENQTLMAVRMVDECDWNAKQRHDARGIDRDIDEQLLNAVLDSREGRVNKNKQANPLEPCDCIPASRNTHIPHCVSRKLPEDAELPVSHSHTDFFGFELGLSVHRAVDNQGNLRKIKLNTLTVHEKVVGTEFVLALAQALKIGVQRATLQSKLISVLRQMTTVLFRSSHIDLTSLFDKPQPGRWHIIDLLTEDNVLMAMMNYCQQNDLITLDFGGLILRSNDDYRISRLQRYIDLVCAARRRALSQVGMAVNMQDLNSYSSPASRRLPLLDFQLDGEVSFHYRSIKKQTVREDIQEYRQELIGFEHFHDEQEEAMWNSEFETKWSEWFAKQLQDNDDDGRMYFAVQGAMCNYGIQIEFNASAFHARVHRTAVETFEYDQLPQPIRVLPIVRIYLHNSLKTRDPFECFFSAEEPDASDESRLTADRDSLMERNDLGGDVLNLCNSLQNVSSEELQRTNLHQLAHQDLMTLLGKQLPDVQDNLVMLDNNVALAQACALYRDTFKYGLMEVIDMAKKSTLVQWSWTARSILELSEQGKQFVDDYNWAHSLSFERAQLLWDDGAWLAWWLEEQTRIADMRLSWQPHMIVRTFQMFHGAVFGRINNDAMWGATMKFADMGESISVLGQSAAGGKHSERIEIRYDRKTPSCGADMCHRVSVEMEAVYNIFCSTDGDVRRFYSSKEAVEYYTLHVSAQKTGTWLGHGIKTDGDGKILDSNWKQQVGSAGVMTEMLKLAATGQSAMGALANIESNLPHSSSSGYVHEQGMDTHQDGKATQTEQLLPMPLKAIASNRFNRDKPKSLLNGGRTKSIISPVQDGLVGRLAVQVFWQDRDLAQGHAQRQQPTAGSAGASASAQSPAHLAGPGPAVSSLGFAQPLRSCVVNAQPRKEKQQVGELTPNKVYKQRAKALYDVMNRRMVSFFHRSLSIGWLKSSYVFGMEWDDLMSYFLVITDGLRRAFMYDSTNETWQRTFEGPFVSATVFPMWIQQNIGRSLLFHMTRATTSVSATLTPAENRNICNMRGVDLQQAHEDALFGLQRHALTFTVVASALYMWLATCVLDLCGMVLFCYQLSMMGFADPCPLYVLALVMNGQPLREKEYASYARLCRFLLPLVTINGRHPYASLLPAAALEEPSDQNMSDWFSGTGDAQARYMHARTRTNADGGTSSVYAHPSMILVNTEVPGWVEMPSEEQRPAKRARKVEPDHFVKDSTQLKIADAFAKLQTSQFADRRAQNGCARDFQHTTRFWAAARKGVRLPQFDSSDSDSKFDYAFENPEHTGWFYQKTMEQVNGMSGMLGQFLTWCGCSDKISRYDFFTKLLTLYAQTEGVALNVHNSRAWKVPILQRHSKQDNLVARSPAFKWAVWPHYPDLSTTNASPQQQGARVALGIDVMQILLGQIYCREWHREAGDSRAVQVMHIRNMGHAAAQILTVWLHNYVQESLIPVGNHVVLQAPCPEAFNDGRRGGVPVVLPIRPEIHHNRLIFRHKQDERETHRKGNVLQHAQRYRHLYQTIEVSNGTQSSNLLFYKGCMQSPLVPQLGVANFPFPPESVAHIHTHMELLSKWVVLYRKQFVDRCSDVVMDVSNVIQEAGSSIVAGTLGVVPLTLTQGLCHEGKELACVSFKGDFMFVLKWTCPAMERLAIASVSPTHLADQDMAWQAVRQWKGLTIADNEELSLTPTQLQLALVDGLWYDDEQRHVLSETSQWWQQHSSRTLSRLMFMMFPMVSWDHLVILETNACLLETLHAGEDDLSNSKVKIADIDTLYEEWEKTLVQAGSEAANMLKSNGVNVEDLLQAGWQIDIMNLGGGLLQSKTCVVWLTDTDKQRFYFNNVAHLQHSLQAGKGNVKNDPARQHWCHRDVLVAKTREFDSCSLESYQYAFLTYNKQQEHLQAIFHTYDNEKYVQMQLQVSEMEWRIHSQETTLQSKQSQYDAKIAAGANPDLSDELQVLQKEIASVKTVQANSTSELDTLKATIDKFDVTVSLDMALTMAPDNNRDELNVIADLRPPLANIQRSSTKACKLALIKPQSADNDIYLQNGRYRIEYAEMSDYGVLKNGYIEMDFVSASRCIIPECSELYMKLDQPMYATIQQMQPRLFIESSLLVDHCIDDDVFLRCFYVLGSTHHSIANAARDAVVRVLIPVRSEVDNEYSTLSRNGNVEHKFTDNSSHDYISCFCRLYSKSGTPLISLTPLGKHIAQHLVRAATSRPCLSSPGPTSSALWLAEEMRC